MGFLDSLGKTLKSLGGAAAAPAGLAFDLASMPFDNKDDDFGSVLSATAHRLQDTFDPLSNSGTWTGYGIGKTMEGLTTAYKQGIDRPLGTAVGVIGHANMSQDYGSLFDADTWAKAYSVSKNRSLGQSVGLNQLALGKATGDLFGGNSGMQIADPLDPNAVEKTKKTLSTPSLFDVGAVSTDLATSWYLDPGVLAGKAASAARMSSLGKLKNFDRLDFEAKLAGTSHATGIKSQDWSGRFDRYFDYIGGSNHLKRPLNGAEIYAATPELQRAAQGKAIAGLMDDAMKLPAETDRRNALRRVIAVGAGDPSQIERIRSESKDAQSLADALQNISQSTTTRLHLQALKDNIGFDPEFNAEFSRQLDNINSQGEIDSFVKDWTGRVQSKLDANERLSSLSGDLDFVPGKHALAGNRGLRVQTHDSIGAKLSNVHSDVMQQARDLAHRESYTGVFQKSIYHMPLVVAHPVGLLAAPYTKVVPGAVAALRQTHFTGVANLHDWNGATTQLDSMMRIAGVDDTTRLAHLSDAYKASSEADKLASIHRVEHAATSALADRMSQKVGRKIDPSFIQELTARGQLQRQGSAARTDGGRIYSATSAPPQMTDQLAARAATNAPDAAPVAGWRVDQIPDENGLPVALPLTVSQLGNRVPLFDIHLANKLTGDAEWTDRFAKLSDAWTAEARDLSGLQAAMKRQGASTVSTLGKAVDAKRATLDALTNAGSVMTRWWKYSVLFRLGYPMRVLMDDHMRIASQMHWTSFASQGMREGIGNSIHNNAPAMIYSEGRKGAARQAFTVAKARRSELVTHFGRDAHTDDEWARLRKAINDGDLETARTLDPDGKVIEHYQTVSEARSLASSITGHKTSISRWKNDLEAAQAKRDLGLGGEDISALHKKIHDAQAAIVDKEAGRAAILEQIGDDPEGLRKELVGLNTMIDRGPSAFRDPKHHLGMSPVKLDDKLAASGVYGQGGATYRLEAGSQEHYNQLLTDGEESTFGLISSGAHRTIGATEPGHLHVWANVLNHQFQNSPELMAFVRGKVNTPAEFAEWLAEPEHAYIRNRMRHFAADPHDWGSRLQELAHDYVPTEDLRHAMTQGPVSARKLAKMFPNAAERPTVHGQLANVNAGRHTATRLFSGAFNRMFRLLSEVPTDALSRHPYMSAMYKQELRDAYAVRKADYAREGREFAQADLPDLERQARIKALGQLKRTLWDVSAHSHAAHSLRFLSPFFAAHQEALTRWWRIASDDPSIVRKFQLAFDAPRKMGLVYDTQTGDLVPQGAGPSMNHSVLLRIPFASENSAANKWLRQMGGGKYWHVNENGFNLILQNGIANPGVGPVVTVPMESLVNRYASQPDIEKMARIINPYPPDSPIQAVEPAWTKRAMALIQGPGNREWGSRYNANLADAIVRFRLDHGEKVPTQAQFDALTDRAAHDTNRDLGLMLLSNVTSPLPAKPDSKYAVVQHGISKIMGQMRSGGHDFTWARDQVSKQYGDIYTALMYSQTNNKSHLSQTYAEVNAMKRYKGILGKTDPSLARMIVGPAAAMDAEADPGLAKYSAAARRFMLNTRVNSHSTETYLSSKQPDEAGVSSLIDAGWTQYGELTNWLQAQADAKGLDSYEEDKTLVAAKRAGLKYLLNSNFAFASDWNQFDSGAGYDQKLADMRQIANNKDLANDPTRSDVYWLGQYLAVRDSLTEALKQRAASGGPSTIEAKANQDLAKTLSVAVKYIRQQNTLFDTYMYHGIIERDPMLTAAPEEN